jgi:4-hydroxythreonine-4-phosphate dehydrogenase
MKPIGLTMGDPAGIGGELTLRAWLARNRPDAAAAPFIAFDDPERLAAVARQMRYKVPLREIACPAEATSVFPNALPIMPLRLGAAPRPGCPDAANAPAVVASIEAVTQLAMAGEIGAVVTNPINKAALYGAGFAYPGHTELLAALTGTSGRQVMMLVSPLLRVVPVTVHASLRESIAMLSSPLITASARTTADALRRDFGVARPRMAVAGLNPHAGESGALGDEEIRIIRPAIESLRAVGEDVFGPWSPDTMFTPSARSRYDVAICMYHDQGLIPLKTLDIDQGVNVTLGLPIVRTSPDHGTAYEIAGQGVANPSSLIAALRLAAELAARR